MRSLSRGLVFVLACVAVLSTSCAVAFQDSVRSSGTQCSTSRFWWFSDALLAGGLAYVVAREDGVAAGYIPSAVLAGSSLIGIIKRRNCVRHQERATPEQWAHDSTRAREKDAARARAMRDMVARMNQPPAPRSQPRPPSAPPPRTLPRVDRTSTPAVTFEHHRDSDEIGKSCKSPHADLPSAGTCQYGALCYAGTCTVRCGVGGTCPAGLQCRWTDGTTRMQICR